ncbi:MAG: NAD(P)-binding domain-containing protein, partial [Gemmatimonadetes bacterium]|nr:NAD(P)-binding domain-containing protein [Gemmatimonadota bacterium]
MDVGMIGLGRMGANMAARLLKAGHRVVAHDPSAAAIAKVVAEGGVAAGTIGEVRDRLPAPRAAWVMVPAGEATEQVIARLGEQLEPGDTVIDGGNSYYRDTLRRAERLRRAGIDMLDVGTSGGVWGLREGYCMMIGGEEAVVERLRPLFEALAPAADAGWGRVGPSVAGHFVKMVHSARGHRPLDRDAAGGPGPARRRGAGGADLRHERPRPAPPRPGRVHGGA